MFRLDKCCPLQRYICFIPITTCTPISVSLSGSLQGYVTRAKRSQVIWSVSLSPLMTQREWLGTERHRKHDLNSPTFISFLPLEVVTRKNKMYLYSSTSPSSPLCGIHHVVLKKKLEKISGSEREENAECRFLISEIREKKVCKNKGGKENVNKSQFLGCLLHALASEKVVCILHTRRCKYSKTKKKRQSVTVYTVRSQGENRNVAAIRKQQRKMYYFLRTHVKKLEYEWKLSICRKTSNQPEILNQKCSSYTKHSFLLKLTRLHAGFGTPNLYQFLRRTLLILF